MNVKNRVVSILAPIASFLLIFAIWEAACRINEIPAWFLPMPSEIFKSMVVDFQDYWPHLLVTLQCVLIGFLIAIPVGLLIATLITSFPLLNAAMSPYITFLVTTPLISLIPLLMLAMGYGMNMRITTVVIQSFAVINMNACTGFNNVPTIRRELMQSVGASRFQTYRMMILPSAATDIITGLRLAAIFATTTCISVEYNAGNTGLGSQIIKYSQYLQTTQSFACIFYVTVIGLIMYGLIALFQKKIVSWQE
ncbi:ABC transporter permease [Pseudoflavonifractor sp. AF19-9AC]|uniref:ABC transporter permease n=1 Tax=Pseudoflavonifractor sp. AF19-9AC TaxID=2292244 RepID=UPI000E51DB01|nr:ABC transporter permease [Pseudoflavonifractor sp. AF19-9AC]RHR06138.1 ABC transporter permease [Pseudoflavonifractor sp. AF19-9AC]